VLVVLLVATVVAVTGTAVLRARMKKEVQAALDDLGAPPGFRRISASATGSPWCFGRCLRGRVLYRAQIPSAEALLLVTAHLRSRDASKSCFFDPFGCTTPLTPEDCSFIDDTYPECLMAVVVNDRDVYVAVSRHGSPTDVRVSVSPKKQYNLI